MIAYVENPKVYKNLLELISELSKDSGNKASIEKSVDFLYTNISSWNLK